MGTIATFLANILRRVAECLDPRCRLPWKAVAKKCHRKERMLRRIILLLEALREVDRKFEEDAKHSVISRGWDELEKVRPVGIFGGRRGGDS